MYYDTVNEVKDLACNPLVNFTSNFVIDFQKTPVFLIERGNCSFVKKAFNVERYGGRAAIIINNDVGDVTKIIMSDDGNGNDVTIPAVLISKQDGDIIRKFFRDNRNNTDITGRIAVTINFEMVKFVYLFFF